jgi:hypothetical protein
MSVMLTAFTRAYFMVLVANFFALVISTPCTIISSRAESILVTKDYTVRDLVRTDQINVCTTH